MAYKLREEEGSEDSKLRLDKDVILKTENSLDNIISALENSKHYGEFRKSIRTPNMNKEIEIHFGPSSKKKQSLEDKFASLSKEEWLDFFSETPDAAKIYDVLASNNGKFYFKTGPALQDFQKNFKAKPNLLYYIKTDNNTLVFPKDNNDGEKYVKKVVDTVMKNAGITDYKFSKEASGTVSEGQSIYELRKLIREEVKNLLK